MSEPISAQTITVVLSDGRTGTFTGPVLVEEAGNELFVTDVYFSKPFTLPPDCRFEEIQ